MSGGHTIATFTDAETSESWGNTRSCECPPTALTRYWPVMPVDTESMAAKVLLSCEPLATHWTGEGPLACVTTDVSLHDTLLLSSVWAEWALVEFHWHY